MRGEGRERETGRREGGKDAPLWPSSTQRMWILQTNQQFSDFTLGKDSARPSVCIHAVKKKKNKERNYGNLTFAVFVPGFKCEQFPSSPLASAKLCRPLEEEVTFLASFRRPCSHMV